MIYDDLIDKVMEIGELVNVQVSKNAVRYQIGKIKFKTIPKDFFLDAYKYLGKSKASIKDLFEVE